MEIVIFLRKKTENIGYICSALARKKNHKISYLYLPLIKKPSFSSFTIKVLQHCPVSQYFAGPSISAKLTSPDT